MSSSTTTSSTTTIPSEKKKSTINYTTLTPSEKKILNSAVMIVKKQHDSIKKNTQQKQPTSLTEEKTTQTTSLLPEKNNNVIPEENKETTLNPQCTSLDETRKIERFKRIKALTLKGLGIKNESKKRSGIKMMRNFNPKHNICVANERIKIARRRIMIENKRQSDNNNLVLGKDLIIYQTNYTKNPLISNHKVDTSSLKNLPQLEEFLYYVTNQHNNDEDDKDEYNSSIFYRKENAKFLDDNYDNENILSPFDRKELIMMHFLRTEELDEDVYKQHCINAIPLWFGPCLQVKHGESVIEAIRNYILYGYRPDIQRRSMVHSLLTFENIHSIAIYYGEVYFYVKITPPQLSLIHKKM